MLVCTTTNKMLPSSRAKNQIRERRTEHAWTHPFRLHWCVCGFFSWAPEQGGELPFGQTIRASFDLHSSQSICEPFEEELLARALGHFLTPCFYSRRTRLSAVSSYCPSVPCAPCPARFCAAGEWLQGGWAPARVLAAAAIRVRPLGCAFLLVETASSGERHVPELSLVLFVFVTSSFRSFRKSTIRW